MGYYFRRALESDCGAASNLVQRSFNAFVASDWSASACATFLAESSPTELRKKIPEACHAELALSEEDPVGFLLMPKPHVLAMLFVDPHHQRRGLGRALWEHARTLVEAQHTDVKTIEVNSTPAAFVFYLAMGFAPISSQFEFEGTRATRMACWLPARMLSAELCANPTPHPDAREASRLDQPSQPRAGGRER